MFGLSGETTEEEDRLKDLSSQDALQTGKFGISFEIVLTYYGKKISSTIKQNMNTDWFVDLQFVLFMSQTFFSETTIKAMLCSYVVHSL